MSDPQTPILLVGATGMIGEAVQAAAGAAPLHLLTRRAIATRAPHHDESVADTAAWPGVIATLRPAVVINCLGTTIRQAGSQAAFRAVDHDLVLAVAQSARSAGARQMISISSVGANARSGNFYLRTKGQVERALTALGFERLDIVRPGLLTGDRQGPARPGEALAMLAAPLTDLLLHGPLRRYRSIAADNVAAAALALSRQPGVGVHIHEHDAIARLAGR